MDPIGAVLDREDRVDHAEAAIVVVCIATPLDVESSVPAAGTLRLVNERKIFDL